MILISESGVAGADRIKSRADFKQFLTDYQKVISQFPGYVSMNTSGSYNSNLSKNDFGDIDLIVHIASDKDKPTVKKELQAFLHTQPETVIVPFTSVKHAGKRSYNSGEIITVRYHDEQLGYSAQIDNIIALSHIEATFKQQFLDMPAEKQGLVLGLTKVATIETDPQQLFKRLGIHAPVLKDPNQEYEFNLSSIEIQLRKVTYKPGTYEQESREVIWNSRDFSDLQKLLYQYDLDSDFNSLLAQSKKVIRNPRSNNRIRGVFDSMITVKSGEVGTAKGAGKEAASAQIAQTFKESSASNAGKKIVFAFGRFQPPTVGHELLINSVKQAAAKANADYVIYVSRKQDHKDNPLFIDAKMKFLHRMFPGTNFVAANDEVRTPIEAVTHLNQQYDELVWVAGGDRVPAFDKLVNDYNGKNYQYQDIQVISSGARDPDSEGAEGMSGTKMRELAVAGDIQGFSQGLPDTMNRKDSITLMNLVQQGLIKAPKKVAKKKSVTAIKEFIARVKPMLETATPEQKVKIYKKLKEARDSMGTNILTEEPAEHHDTELDTIADFAKQHYPEAKTSEEALKKLIFHSIKHNREDDEQRDGRLDSLEARLADLERMFRKMPKTAVAKASDNTEEK